MSTVSFLHARLADSLLLFFAIAAVGSLVAALRRSGVSSAMWGVLAVGELLALAQAGLGVATYVAGGRPARDVHILYGIVAVVSLPAYYAFSRGRDDRRASWAYALMCLFLAGISARAASTGA